jgi:serine/threonine protein kinase
VGHYGAVADATDLRPGDPEQIAGYQVVSRLGAGGQGVVYLATSSSGQRVAIKQLRFGPDDERARQQFVKEVAAARLVAPFCTAQVLDAQLDGPSPYVISEYIEGLSLQQRIERRGPMTDAALQRLAVGTATALAAIHQAGVVHRDFKPANVMLAYDGPRVIDFGIARDLSTETTVTSRIFGTPAYMAPEQLRAERVGPATDMFAWGSVIAYAATGRAPFEAPHMMAVMHRISSSEPDLAGVPAEMVAVLRRCLDKDPAGRPTAQQVLALLLGRPAPVHDASDPTQVLAEATGLVHAGAVKATTQGALPNGTARDSGRDPATGQPWWIGSPTRPAPSPQDVSPSPHNVRPGPSSGSGPSPGSSSASGDGDGAGPRFGRKLVRALAGVVVILLVGVGGAWAVDQFGGDQRPSGAQPSGPADQTVIETPPADQNSGDQNSGDENSGDQNSGDENSGDLNGGNQGNGGKTEEGTVPEVFDGTWKGNGYQPRGRVKSWAVEVKLRGGEAEGKLELPDLDCSGDVTVTSATDKVLELVATMDDNPEGKCAAGGLVRLTLRGPEAMQFYWQDSANPENEATGFLARR